MEYLNRSKVLVTGSNSMIGREVVKCLKNRKAKVFEITRRKCDLVNFNEVNYIFGAIYPDYVIHLATHSGNIQFNQKYPADTFYYTSQMALNVLRCCQLYNVKKSVSILSSCAIADCGKPELSEDDLWTGLPNNTIECHGLAKRTLDAYSRQLKRQYDINAVCCIVNNSFGPFDSFNEFKTKVVGALIKKFVTARKQGLSEVICWGTGKPLREFIYCKDAAEGIVQVLEKYYGCFSPINITSGIEVSIKELTEIIAGIVGYEGKITWDISKGDGQMRKKLSKFKMDKYIDLNITPLKDALEETILWYIENEVKANAK